MDRALGSKKVPLAQDCGTRCHPNAHFHPRYQSLSRVLAGRWWRAICTSAFLRRQAKRRVRWLFSLLVILLPCALVLIFFFSVDLDLTQQGNQDNSGTFDLLSSPQQALLVEDEIDAKVLRPHLTHGTDVCLVCAEGHVLFRSGAGVTDMADHDENLDGGGKNTAATAAQRTGAQDFTVCAESVEARAAAAVVSPSQHRRLLLRTAHDCVARLHNLGLLRSPRATETAEAPGHSTSCVHLRVALHVLAGDAVIAPVRCSAVVAQLHRSHEGEHNNTPPVELTTPRLTVWPMRLPTTALIQSERESSGKGEKVHHGGGNSSSKGGMPLYFGTAAVKDTDVDSDVSPPSSIELRDTLDGIVVHFPSPSTLSEKRVAPAPDLHCPLHFLTVRLGRFGRHHNQLQEVLNGLALAARLNRTFLVPPFVPKLYISFLKLDSQILYGWHTLREVGRYCLLTYTEARPVLRKLYTNATNTTVAASMKAAMTMARVHFATDATAQAAWHVTSEWERRVWGYLPRLPLIATNRTSASTAVASATAFYDGDEWFACGVRKTRSGQALLRHRVGGDSGGVEGGKEKEEKDEAALLFREVHGPLTNADLHLDRDATGTCWENYRTGVQALMTKYGGAARRRLEGRYAFNQPDLVVLSSATAFHARPRLEEMTRLLGLLRPSPYIISEVGRFYRLWARQYQWPPYTNPKRIFNDCLQPWRLRGVIGLHVRRRELTCRREAEHPSQTILALTEGRYVLDGTVHREEEQAAAAVEPPPLVNSTVARLVSDCVWDVRTLLHLFDQYSRWMTAQREAEEEGSRRGHHRHGTTAEEGSDATAAAAAELTKRSGATTTISPRRYTSFIAYDEQAGPIGQEMEVALQRRYHPSAKELLADGIRPSFTAVYDRRSRVSFREEYEYVRGLLKAPAVDPTNATAVEEAAGWKMDRLIALLYSLAEEELMSVAFDFFMLSNTEVFRGNTLSSFSVNVCVRRWGRGLPCHGVMAGYYETLYKGFP